MSNYITSDLNNLALHDLYSGSDDVVISYGHGFAIKNTRSTTISTNKYDLRLTNVLHVPSMAKNLISVYKLCVDNNVSVIFDPSAFQVKDLSSGIQVTKGKPKYGMYEWPLISS